MRSDLILKRLCLAALMLCVPLLAGAAEETTPTLQVEDRLLTASSSSERNPNSVIDTVMLHFVSDVSENPENPHNVDRIIEIFETYKVGAHYLIDREGKVMRLVPEERAAHHAGLGMLDWQPDRKNKLNHFSIGIEIMAMGSEKDMKPYLTSEEYQAMRAKHPEWFGFTDAQYAALKVLIDDIRSRHSAIKFDRHHIVGHEEYARTRRTDPGELFDYTKIGLSQRSPATTQ